jgi:hypothetical protein
MSEHVTERQLRESLHGLDQQAVFSDAMPPAVAETPLPSYQTDFSKYAGPKMEQYAFPFPVKAMPNRVHELSEEVLWEARSAEDPFLALWSKSYVARVNESVRLSKNAHRSRYEYMSVEERQRNQAMIESMPVLHGTSFDAATAAMRSGHFLTNRQLHEQGVDVTKCIGATLPNDRRLGLDNYVFGDFGRLHSSRGTDKSEVIVVFEQSVMEAPGTFLTMQDIESEKLYREDGVHDMRSYMGGAVLPHDFYDVAVEDIRRMDSTDGFDQGRRHGVSYRLQTVRDFASGRDANLDMFGRPNFSTWEVKMPEATTEHVRKLLFTNPEQHAAFVAEFGDSVASEVVSPRDIAAGRGHAPQYELDEDGEYVKVELRDMQEIFGTYEVFDQRLEQVREREAAQLAQTGNVARTAVQQCAELDDWLEFDERF